MAAASATKEIRWKRRPIIAGLFAELAEVALRERPGQKYPPVATRATAAVVPDFDWRTNGVLWGVTFHRYTPTKPLEMRVKRNETTGQDVEIPPPPAIDEKKLGGRLPVEGEDLAAAMREGKKRCEDAITAGRPA